MPRVNRWPSAPRESLLLALREHDEEIEAKHAAARRRGLAISAALRRKTDLADQEADE